MFYCITYGLFCRTFHVHLTGMCICCYWVFLWMFVRSVFTKLFESYISLLLFCLVILSVIESGLLKSPIITVELSISPTILSVFASCIVGLWCLVHICLYLLYFLTIIIILHYKYNNGSLFLIIIFVYLAVLWQVWPFQLSFGYCLHGMSLSILLFSTNLCF